ncbi:MAG: MBOAT family protein [Bacteroidota bacterium]
MVFSSLVFLFLFLPVILLGHAVIPHPWRNYFLLVGSLIFLAWGGIELSVLLLISIGINYLCGRLIGRQMDQKGSAKAALGFGIALNLLLLGTFKYANFLVENLNLLLGKLNMEALPDPGIVLPIGISFYTFQAISYLVDVYRKETPVQRHIGHLALYIALFPQLIAGPIVRYESIHLSLSNRRVTPDMYAEGIRRFLIGLGKKVLIANPLAYIVDTIFALPPDGISTSLAWVGALGYTFQIFFDFSGYSDMAIGLGNMLGFRFPENFNLPYLSTSIREFWQRWHMSLSSWFRDYLYIPLGGNRKGGRRTVLNLWIVFLLTGLWHGASWNFVLWGMWHGLFLSLERIGKVTPFPGVKLMRGVFTFWVVVMGWVLFRAPDIGFAWEYLQAMYLPQSLAKPFHWEWVFNRETFLVAILAIFFGFGGGKRLLSVKGSGTTLFRVGEVLLLLGIFLLSIAYLVAESYNPFIYFRF